MCTGRSPFRAETTVAVIRRICDGSPRPLREVNPDVPEWLAEIIETLHAKDPAKRFQSAAAVAEILERCLADLQHPQVARARSKASARATDDRRQRTVRCAVYLGGACLFAALVASGYHAFRSLENVADDVQGEGTARTLAPSAAVADSGQTPGGPDVAAAPARMERSGSRASTSEFHPIEAELARLRTELDGLAAALFPHEPPQPGFMRPALVVELEHRLDALEEELQGVDGHDDRRRSRLR